MSSHAPEPPLGDGAARARVFQGGTYLDLHKMLGVTSGSQVPRQLPIYSGGRGPIYQCCAAWPLVQLNKHHDKD